MFLSARIVFLSVFLTSGKACDQKWLRINLHHVMCKFDIGREVVLDQATKNTILQLHNEARSDVIPLAADMLQLIWDDELAIVAGKWARQCKVSTTSTTVLQVPSLPGVQVGQNGDASEQIQFPEIVKKWIEEKKYFVYNFGSKGGNALRYTQIISAKTQRVGCGQALCHKQKLKWIFFCNYAYGLQQENLFRPYTESNVSCKGCPSSCNSIGQLCDCGLKTCFNYGKLDVKTCSCNCANVFTGDTCMTFRCPERDRWFCEILWSKVWCTKLAWVPIECPYMCATCHRNG